MPDRLRNTTAGKVMRSSEVSSVSEEASDAPLMRRAMAGAKKVLGKLGSPRGKK